MPEMWTAKGKRAASMKKAAEITGVEGEGIRAGLPQAFRSAKPKSLGSLLS